jgi:hypothetical protein
MRPAFLVRGSSRENGREKARRQAVAPMPSGHFLKARLKKDFLSYVTIWMATRSLHLSETRSGRIPIMPPSDLIDHYFAQGTEMARVFMLVISGVIMLLAQFNNGSAAGGGGPFDGHWTGSAS